MKNPNASLFARVTPFVILFLCKEIRAICKEKIRVWYNEFHIVLTCLYVVTISDDIVAIFIIQLNVRISN